MEGSLQLDLPALPESVACARSRVAEEARGHQLDDRIVDDARLATSEAVTNVVRHAYGARSGSFELTVAVDADALVVVVQDFGSGLPAGGGARREIGSGYGLALIDAVTDDWTISSIPGRGTTVRMSFALDDHLGAEPR